MAWRVALIVCLCIACWRRADGVPPPPGDIAPSAPRANGVVPSHYAPSGPVANEAAAVRLPEVTRWAPDDLTDTPIIQYPGQQYVGRTLDQWFTNRYLIGCGRLGIDALARTYYVNDQRIQWSGLEETFATEAALTSRYERCFDDIGVAVGGDFFLTQPYDRNLLDDRERRSYFANYDYRTFDISQLYLEVQKGRLACRAGKFITPFGRYYYPVDTNIQFDAPFIRTECIRKRETGVLLSYVGDRFTADVGLVNGCDDRDSNSTKAAIGRIGWRLEPFTIGISGKIHDGIGSEEQKAFNNHLGVDACWQAGKWTVSGEVIYDEHGFYHPFDADDIFWEHSLYYREVNKGLHERISGVGWYVDCLYRGERWLLEFNYGQYHPEEIGIPQHDAATHRGIVRVGFDIIRHLQIYNVVMIESGLADAQSGRDRIPWLEMAGIQYLF